MNIFTRSFLRETKAWFLGEIGITPAWIEHWSQLKATAILRRSFKQLIVKWSPRLEHPYFRFLNIWNLIWIWGDLLGNGTSHIKVRSFCESSPLHNKKAGFHQNNISTRAKIIELRINSWRVSYLFPYWKDSRWVNGRIDNSFWDMIG